ncbi:MAG: exosome complex protein Rrp42 [Desulfurococcales archaeon]|nr:exosome complex protein Rrp42 [Desulfurococcales archaeon]
MSVTPFRLPVVASLRKEAIEELLARGLRIDGVRDPFTPRNVRVELGVVEKAEGSALVKLGNTQVMAGVKMDVGAPFRDTPDQGVLTVHAEFVPLASPLFEPGPPDENAIELARVVDRSLREVGAVDLGQLVIRPGDKVWVVWIDLYILDHDGNLFDASMLAAMAALLDARMPYYEEIETGDVIVDHGVKTEEKLPIRHRVVTVTVAKIGRNLAVDPNFEEESVSDVRLVYALDESGRIVGIQKSGEGALKREEVLRALEMAKRAAPVYFKALEEALTPAGPGASG